jgi:hypothetical protein
VLLRFYASLLRRSFAEAQKTAELITELCQGSKLAGGNLCHLLLYRNTIFVREDAEPFT